MRIFPKPEHRDCVPQRPGLFRQRVSPRRRLLGKRGVLLCDLFHLSHR